MWASAWGPAMVEEIQKASAGTGERKESTQRPALGATLHVLAAFRGTDPATSSADRQPGLPHPAKAKAEGSDSQLRAGWPAMGEATQAGHHQGPNKVKDSDWQLWAG